MVADLIKVKCPPKKVENELAYQATVLSEKSFNRRFYVRLQVHSLWSIEGINGALPLPVKNTWIGTQAMIEYQI
jgi:hypothetical protein